MDVDVDDNSDTEEIECKREDEDRSTDKSRRSGLRHLKKSYRRDAPCDEEYSVRRKILSYHLKMWY